MGGPSWTILIPTLGERRDLFDRLMRELLPQTDPHGGRVQVLVYWNNGRPSLPEIRQLMMGHVKTDYLCCVDDDDRVPSYYVEEILAAIDQRPDYVGFQVQCYSDGVPTSISYHSLDYRGWWNEETAYYRDFSHLNPIRTELARIGNYRRAYPGWPEDRIWVKQLRATRDTRQWRQVMIDKVMYHYLFSTSKTAGIGSRWQKPNKIQRRGYQPLVIDHPNLIYYPGCLP